MQIVINMPEDVYKHIMEMQFCISGIRSGKGLLNEILYAIRTGTPLPKNHGELKDFDKIEWYGCDLEGRGCIEAKGDCSVCNHANCYAKQVRELPTIIEADKAESEGKE